MELKELVERLHKKGKFVADCNRVDALEIIKAVATQILQGEADLKSAEALFSVRYSLQTLAERQAEEKNISL